MVSGVVLFFKLSKKDVIFFSLQAFADQCDAVSRRMGFMPLPLSVVMIRVISAAFKINTRGAPVVCFMAYLALLSFR